MSDEKAGKSDAPTIFLIDGTYTVFRSFFAISGLSAPDGTPTGGVFGFVNSIRKLLTDHAPEYIVVAFDLEGPTHRDALYDQYKANRPPPPDDLIPQFALAHEACDVLGWPVVTLPGYEADDVIATLAAQATRLGMSVVVVTADKDLYQLVGDGVTVLNLSKAGRILDDAGIVDVFGVRPERVVDVLALMGDAVDNVPGVPGVGEKTAKRLVTRYGGLPSIIRRAKAFAAALTHRDAALAALAAGDRQEAVSALCLLADVAQIVADIERSCGDADALELAERFDALSRRELDGDIDAKAWTRRLKQMSRKTQPKTWVAIAENLDQLELSRILVTVARDAPVGFDLGGMRPGRADREAAAKLFGRLGFRRLTDEMHAPHEPSQPNEPNEPQEREVEPPSEVAADRFAVEVIRTAEELAQAVENLARAGLVAFDTETDGLDPRLCRLVGVSLAGSETGGVYLPVGHIAQSGAEEARAQLEWAEARPLLARLLEDPDVRKVAQNYKFDRAVLRHAGIVVRGLAFDTLIAAQLLDPGRSVSHKLDDLASRHLGLQMIPYDRVAKREGKNVSLDLVDIETVAAYAVEDAVVTLRLAPVLERLLRENDLDGLHEELELPLIAVLEEMQEAGIRVDTDALARMSGRLEQRLAVLLQEIWTLAGHEFNVNSPAQLRTVLFDELGLRPTGRRTQKTKAHSTGQESLEALAALHPLPTQVLRYRELAKLKSTYVDAIPRLVDPRDGRVHGQFHQLGAATGRLSSSDPNLQNIPVRTELGREIRAAFVPDPGQLFVGADYSQMELRILAHLSDDPALIDAFQRELDIHVYTASLVESVAMDEVTDAMRRRAKAVNFGIVYGMSEYRLAREQGMTTEEARAFIASYFARYPEVRRYIDGVTASVQETGEVRTLFGRVRRFPELVQGTDGQGRRLTKPMREQLLRQAVNATVQGTAADLVKRAMIRLRRRLQVERLAARLVLQVHDELLFEAPERQAERVAQVVKHEMERAASLSVPLAVEVAIAADWAGTH